MIVEIPGCKFRIKGEDTDWSIQYPQKRGEDGESWNGKYFYSRLEHAVSKAYDLALRELSDVVDFADVPAKCREVAKSLEKAVAKAVANG